MRTYIRAALLATLILVTTLGIAQDINKFRLTAGTAISGSEEYRITKTAAGTDIAGKLNYTRGTVVIAMNDEAALAADYSPVRYKLSGKAGPQEQTIEAWREGGVYQMKVSVGGESRLKQLDAQPHTLLLDNLVASHFQTLLDAAGKAPVFEFTALVPQAMAAVPAKLEVVGEDNGMLSHKPLRLRRYRLSLGSLVSDIWADAATNRLMRFFVPLQTLELLRDGFEPTKTSDAALPDSVTERQVTFASGTLHIPGTLCSPAKAVGKVPVAVLVHGSGPNDRDETIGPNKVFRDIAWEFAKAGIATLRYDKRTYLMRTKTIPVDPKLTVDDEVIADAVAAIKYASSLPEADSSRVFLLGHSLGASMAPFIAERAPAVRGVILMAGAARPFDELMSEQIAFQMKVNGQSEQQIQAQLEALKQQFARVRSGEAKDDEMISIASARYWRDLLAHDVPGALKKLSQPILVLRGESDVQISRVDYDEILKALAGRPPAQLEAHSFPGLNHLFMNAPKQATGGEYAIAGHVDAQAINIMTLWIKKQAAAAGATAR